ncbi:MAG: efflux RND transporter periplasmic adaptor subunit [Thermoguttaceae bacterium]|jgi:HlyD family secretion protein
MKKRAAFLLILLLALAAFIGWWRYGRPQGQSEQLTLYGNVDIRTAQLAFDGEAIVTSMRVEEGAQVKAGQVLATLDSSRKRAELDEAKALVDAQEAVVRRLESGTREQEIEQARAHVASLEAKLANAEQRLQRYQRLTPTGLSQEELDDAQMQVRVERAGLDEAKQGLALALEGPRQEDIDEARARLEANRARVRLLERWLADTELRAPSAGTIRSRLLEPGDYATRGRAAYTLALTDPKWIRAYVPEPSLGRVRQGSRASVTTDSFPGVRLEGWVGFISPMAEFTPKSVETTELRTQLVYEVRIYVADPQDRLRLGMPATVVVDEASPPAAAPLPAAESGVGQSAPPKGPGP